jgi:hypothetical protein
LRPRLVGVPGVAVNFIFAGPHVSPFWVCVIVMIPLIEVGLDTVPVTVAFVTIP